MPRPNVALGLSLRNSYSREVFEGFVDYAAQHTTWELLPLSDRDVLEARLIREYRVAAILINEPEPPRIRQAGALRLPVVNVANVPPASPVPGVMTDNHAVGKMVAEYFIGKGCRHFGFCGTQSRTSAMERLAGFRAGISRLGIAPICCWHPAQHPRDLYEPEVERVLLRWLKKLPQPVGILAGTDRIASQLTGLCSRHGLRVPADFSIVGVGQDELIQKLARLPITSVVLGSRTIGLEAARMLHQLMSGRKTLLSPVLVPPVRIVEGRSTNSTAVNDPVINRATDFMLAHLGESFGIEEVAAATGRSRRSLERHFAGELGLSPHDHLKNLRLEKIRQLVATSDETLDNIARLVGLSDGSHLSVFFKAETGETPSSYRRRCSASPSMMRPGSRQST